ncbi:MAG: hypothetical protein IPF58_09715 [Saprospirales bacterium]|nr:hypothetical protein [Saprospirales bacterium]
MNDFQETFHNTISDYKSYLLEWAQARKKTVLFAHNTTPDAQGIFTVVLKLMAKKLPLVLVKTKRIGTRCLV